MTADSPPPDDSASDASASDASASGEAPFIVVGLGASAGGLEALDAFFSGLPTTDSAAFVVVVHLDPERESDLAAILERSVPLPVHQVTETTRIERGHVYVIAPGHNLRLDDGRLSLEPLEDERQRRRPIDHFFRTLAAAYGDHAVAVVLSGMGHDGTVGARTLKEAGGLILAQDPDDAAFDEMPRSALAADIVDMKAPAAELGAAVIAYSASLHRVHLPDTPEAALPKDDVRAVQRVLAQMRTRTGHDFSHYKRSTVLRRLERRLHVVGADSLDAYLAHLRAHPDEADELLKDLLISVTNFFRDPAAFEAFEREVVPRLFDGKGPTDQVRAWVVGCATGEEAYSVAMLLAEHAATLDAPPGFQIFATDLSERAIATARAGLYSDAIEADVSAERLQRFFHHEAAGYRVVESLRERVLFATHSLLRDPPFSRVDLVTCRNLLIYFQRTLQQQALDVFHYALVPGGYLFLGTSETADAARARYQPADKAARLYRRRDGEPALPALAPVARVALPPAPPPATGCDDAPSVAELHRQLRAEASPPSVLLSDAHEIVHLSDDAGRFFLLGGGEPTRHAIRLLRPELRAAAQTALFQVRRADPADGPTAGARASLAEGDQTTEWRLRAVPADGSDMVQLLFETLPSSPASPLPVDATGTEQSLALGAELEEAREQLQLTSEEFETSREELKAQNEELQSVNEELRSTAEELETSKEEAQATAEEIQTVNDDLKSSVDELAVAKGDLENLIASTGIATLFLDRALRIKRFTPQVREHFAIREADLGRPLDDLAHRFGDGRLVDDARSVMDDLRPTESEMQSETGRWHLVQTRPYRTVDDHIEGVVVSFVDITERRAAETALHRSGQHRLFAVEAAGVGDWAYEVASGEMAWSERALAMMRRLPADAPTHAEHVALMHPDDRDAVASAIAAAVDPAGTGRYEAAFRFVFPDGSATWIESRGRALFEARPVPGAALQATHIFGAMVDVTPHKEAVAALRTSDALFNATLSTITDFAYVFDRDGRFVFVNQPLLDLWGRTLDDAVGKNFHELDYPEPLATRLHQQIETVFQTGQRLAGETPYTGADGIEGHYEYIFNPFVADDGTVALVVGSTRDVTARRHDVAALRASEAHFREAAETVPDILFTATSDGLVDYANRSVEEMTGEPVATVIGTPLWPDLIHPDDRDGAVAAWAEAVAGGTPYEARYRLHRPDGGYGWVIVRARPIADGDAPRWFGTCTDIDSLVSAEHEVQTLNATLEARVRQRTHEVRRLAARLTVAEQEERKRIAQVLHDDLQQQLFGLSMLLDLIRRTPPGESLQTQAEEAAAVLGEAVATARTLTTELSPSVLQADRLDDVLQWIAEETYRRHGLRVEVDVEGTPDVADEALRILLYQILRELLFNVVKHAGGATARLRAWQSDGHVTLVVEDDGAGFDRAAIEAHADGFGLASVRERLELVGGQFAIASAPGEGTRVTLSVPSHDGFHAFP